MDLFESCLSSLIRSFSSVRSLNFCSCLAHFSFSFSCLASRRPQNFERMRMGKCSGCFMEKLLEQQEKSELDEEYIVYTGGIFVSATA